MAFALLLHAHILLFYVKKGEKPKAKMLRLINIQGTFVKKMPAGLNIRFISWDNNNGDNKAEGRKEERQKVAHMKHIFMDLYLHFLVLIFFCHSGRLLCAFAKKRMMNNIIQYCAFAEWWYSFHHPAHFLLLPMFLLVHQIWDQSFTISKGLVHAENDLLTRR